MNRQCRNASSTVTLKEVTSVLVSDYEALQNKPAINGVELTKSTTSKDISEFSTIPGDHPLLTLTTAVDNDVKVMTLDDEGGTGRVALGEIVEEGTTLRTVDEIDDTIGVGKYMFVKI